MNIRTHTLPALLVGALLASSAHAAADTADLTVKLKINGTCAITAATLQFSPQTGPVSNNIDNEAKIIVKCTNGQSYEVGFGNGLHSQTGSPPQRRMKAVSAPNTYVNYQLYTNAGRAPAQVANMSWGTQGTIGPQQGNGNNQEITVYGRVPPIAAPTADDYQDTVLMTINF